MLIEEWEMQYQNRRMENHTMEMDISQWYGLAKGRLH